MIMRLHRPALYRGLVGVVILMGFVLLGSRKLVDFDAALTPYFIASVFAIFGCIYRYSVWLSRPSTNMLWKRSLDLMFSNQVLTNFAIIVRAFVDNMLLQKFIGKRSPYRWVMHFLIAWGCVAAFAVTFPLVFGWLHFSHPLNDPLMYQLEVIGFPLMVFDPYGIVGFLFFNALNFCSVMIIIGVLMAFIRRLIHPGEITTQSFAADLLPLMILFAVSISGLFLTFSTHFLQGQHYRILSTVHCWTVVAFLVYLPFGKFFHIFQRAAQMGAELYIYKKSTGELAVCPKLKEGFTSQVQKEDVKKILKDLGFKFQVSDDDVSIQDLSPQARRQLLMTVQHKHLKGQFQINSK